MLSLFGLLFNPFSNHLNGNLNDALHLRIDDLETKPSTEFEGDDEDEDGGGVIWSSESLITDLEEGPPQTAAVFGEPSAGDSGNAPRAAGAAGAMIGCLVAVSSIMWAAYKIKPGWFKGGSSGILKITSTSNAYQPVVTKDVSMTAVGAGASAGDGGGYTIESANPIKTSTTFGNSKFNSNVTVESKVKTTSDVSMTQGAQNGAVEFSGTINRGNQTDFADGDFSTMQSGKTMNIYDTTAAYSNLSGGRTLPGNHGYSFDEGGFSYNQSSANQRLSPAPVHFTDGQMRNTSLNYNSYNQFNQQQDVFLPPPPQQQQQQQFMTQQQQQFLIQQRQLQQQLQQQQLLQQQQQQQQQQTFQHNFSLGSSGASTMQQPNLMSPEEIRVDCVQLTTNGRYVVTGSIHGPPQIWDMKVGCGLARLLASYYGVLNDVVIINLSNIK